MGKVLQLLIRCYQWVIRPYLGSNCRFHPSCSCYAHEAIGVHGARRGAYLAARRLLRCHPWNPGGFDPVPQSGADNAVSSELLAQK